MAYGLRLTNAANQVVMDTSLESSIQVIEQSSLTANSTLDRATGDFYYFNRSTTGRLKVHYDYTNDRYRNDSGITISYARCRVVKDATVPTSPNYGLETYDSTGRCTYSMGYDKGYKLLSLFNSGELYNDYWESESRMYSGDPADIYVYTGRGQVIGATDFLNMSYWDYTSNYISFHSQLDLSAIGGGLVPLANDEVVAVIKPRN